MSAIQWIVFLARLALLAAPSQPKEVLYSTEYYNDYNTNDAFVTREGESTLVTEELSRSADTKAQEQSYRQTIRKLRQEIQDMQVDNTLRFERY